MEKEYYSNGKLLLTAEYAVLDGATALAIPTKFGQNLILKPLAETNTIHWQSIDSDGSVWFTTTLKKNTLAPIAASNIKMGQRLSQILFEAKRLNPDFLHGDDGLSVETVLTFDRHWGLGTSSTLINNIANWADVNPYDLLENTFGGSGYDIACAQHKNSILYTLETKSPVIAEVKFQPVFATDIYFVYLNRKQDSRLAIKNYKGQLANSSQLVAQLSQLTHAILKTERLSEFQSLLTSHEQYLSKALKQIPVKERFFSDYDGAIKSLGGWGGDFVMAAGNKKTPAYFKDRGFSVVIPYKDMVLRPVLDQ